MMTHIQRLLVTGSRNFENFDLMSQVFAALLEQHSWSPEEIVLVSGNARGADSIAEGIFEEWGFNVERHPADWNKLGRKAGVLRNQEMVDSGADVCVAFPVGQSVGTHDCMKRADKAGIPVFMVDGVTGSVERWHG